MSLFYFNLSSTPFYINKKHPKFLFVELPCIVFRNIKCLFLLTNITKERCATIVSQSKNYKIFPEGTSTITFATQKRNWECHLLHGWGWKEMIKGLTASFYIGRRLQPIFCFRSCTRAINSFVYIWVYYPISYLSSLVIWNS